MKKKSHFVIFTTVSVIAILVIATFVTTSLIGVRYQDGKWYHRETSFNFTGPDQGSCAAMTPACGVCTGAKGNGILVNKICYLEN